MEQAKVRSLLEMEHNSVEYLHVLVEAMRLVWLPLSGEWLTYYGCLRLAFAGKRDYCLAIG